MKERFVRVWRGVRPFVKPWLVCFAIYCVAMLSIWRGGVSFIDDRARAMDGYTWSTEYNRYSSSVFAMLLNANHTLMDISPWPQMVAMGIMSAVSVIITYVFCGRKIKYLPLILTTVIGLQPFIAECWLYKFDAPCMALSILVAVLPILWWPKDLTRKSLVKFGGVAGICMMIVWTSYQASNGILIVMCTMMGLKDHLDGVKFREIMKKWLVGLGACAVTGIVYLYLPNPSGYRGLNVGMTPMEIAEFMVADIAGYAKFVWDGLNVWQKWFLLPLMVAGAVTLLFINYRKKAWGIILVGLVCLPMSVGVYLFLDEPILNARTLVGMGVVGAVILVLATRGVSRMRDYALAGPSVVMLYTCVIFLLALGNGLVDQEKYGDFRTENLLSALAELYLSATEETTIQINGEIGYSATMQHVVDEYPLAGEIVNYQQKGLGYGVFGQVEMARRYGWPQDFQVVDLNWGIRSEHVLDCEMVKKVVRETYYYTVYDEGEGLVCVELRE